MILSALKFLNFVLFALYFPSPAFFVTASVFCGLLGFTGLFRTKLVDYHNFGLADTSRSSQHFHHINWIDFNTPTMLVWKLFFGVVTLSIWLGFTVIRWWCRKSLEVSAELFRLFAPPEPVEVVHFLDNGEQEHGPHYPALLRRPLVVDVEDQPLVLDQRGEFLPQLELHEGLDVDMLGFLDDQLFQQEVRREFRQSVLPRIRLTPGINGDLGRAPPDDRG